MHLWPRGYGDYPTLKNCLLGAVKLRRKSCYR